jgi:hypothetical protein
MVGLPTRWLVLMLGGILLATTVLFGPVTNADAQGQSQAKGKKAQGQVQGQENGTANGLGHQKVAVCHKNEKTLYLPPPAVDAHERHGDTPGACGDTSPPPPAECDDGEDNDGDTLVDFPDDPGCEDADDNDEADDPVTTECNDGEDNDGDTLVDFPDDPGCEDADDNDEADIVVAAGTLSTKSGEPVLKVRGGDVLKLEAKSTKGEKRLEALAKKTTKVKVTGKKSGNTLEVSQLKTTKGKQKK